jgi:ATP-dependent Clp protease ATP-binding subunit ClpA
LYPFERFTDHSKKVLTLAQDEAEKSHHSYIGTEHLLLGLLREGEGHAARVLTNLGVGLEQLRDTIDSTLGRNERIIVQQIIPTSRVKKVIEIAFEEAKRTDNAYVGTEHLLLGLLIEGEGIACHVLHDLGADLNTVPRELASVVAEHGYEEPTRVEGEGSASAWDRSSQRGGHIVRSFFHDLSQFTSEANSAMALAEEEAAKAGLGYLGTEHLLLGLLRQGEGMAAQALNNVGVTVAAVRLELAAVQRNLPLHVVPRVEPNRRLLRLLSTLAPQEVANLPRHLLDTQHLLLALVVEADDPAARVLEAVGATASTIREEVKRLEADSAA